MKSHILHSSVKIASKAYLWNLRCINVYVMCNVMPNYFMRVSNKILLFLARQMFFPCLQPDTSIFLRLRELSSGWQIVINFSYKQRLQRYVALDYGLHFFRIFHLMEISFHFGMKSTETRRNLASIFGR